MPLAPQKTIEIKTPDGRSARIRVYAMGIVIERGDDSRAFISGVEVPLWLITKAKEEIEPRELFRISKPAVRDRFVRKLGVRRVMIALKGRTLCKRFRDRLIAFDDEGRRRVYLHRRSWGDPWRLEYVDPAIKSFAELEEWEERRWRERRAQEKAWAGIHS